MPESKLTVLRRRQIGFVFQAINLVPALTVRQNITLPLRLAGTRAERHQLADILHRVGLADSHGSHDTGVRIRTTSPISVWEEDESR